MFCTIVANRQQDDVRWEDALRPWNCLDATLAVWSLANTLDIHGVEALHTAIFAAEVGCMDAIDALAALFVGRAQLENMGRLWPPRVELWHIGSEFRVDLELMDTRCPLADGGSVAVSAGITTTDDQDMLSTCIDRVLDRIPSNHTVLARQVIHGKVDTAELAARDIEVTRPEGANANKDSIIFAEEVLATDIHANITVRFEENAFGFEELEAAVKHGTIQPGGNLYIGKSMLVGCLCSMTEPHGLPSMPPFYYLWHASCDE
jgi:hypothetical protein